MTRLAGALYALRLLAYVLFHPRSPYKVAVFSDGITPERMQQIIPNPLKENR